jgi:hypothetical protein
LVLVFLPRAVKKPNNKCPIRTTIVPKFFDILYRECDMNLTLFYFGHKITCSQESMTVLWIKFFYQD